ncbi:MAG: hypothetical protein HON04_10155 [Planctomicrobium sp.]|nr:hypothetical protein [Planctomicrobium sp.]
MNSNLQQTLSPEPYADGISRQALHFFALAAGSLTTATLIMWSLSHWFGKLTEKPDLIFPPSFLISSTLLGFGSLALTTALQHVRHERQREFRFWLLLSRLTGTLFMGVQGYALWSIFPDIRTRDSATVDSLAFILCLTALHCLHLLIATLFVAFIISRAWANRYDHEYYWGVRICVWFWHFLLIVWLAIMAIISIAY